MPFKVLLGSNFNLKARIHLWSLYAKEWSEIERALRPSQRLVRDDLGGFRLNLSLDATVRMSSC